MREAPPILDRVAGAVKLTPMTEPLTPPPEHPPRRLPVALLVSLAVLVLIVGIAYVRFSSLRSPVPPPPETSSPQALGPPPSATLPTGPVVTGPPAMDTAFAAAFPSPQIRVQTDAGETNVRFSPAAFYALPEGGYVLLSRGENLDDTCHACSGFYAITYLTWSTGPTVVGAPFVREGGNSGMGPDLKVVEGLAGRPMAQATSSFTSQGATETNADFVWLGRSPAEVFVAMAGVPIGYDDEGGEAKCAITSKLRRGPADTIEVIYGGSWNGRATYLKTGRQFEPTDKLDLSAKCPGAEPG